MRYVYTILLTLFSLSVSGQELLFLFENNANDAMGLHNATAYGDIVYSTSKVMQGTYSCDFSKTGARFSTNNTVDLTSGGMTVSFGLHYYNESGLPVIASNMATSSSDGWAIYLDRDNKRIGYFVRNGANTGWAYSANNSLPNTDTWYYVTVAVMDVAGQYAKIFVNGSQSGTDTTTVTGGGPANSAVHIGSFGNGSYTLFERVDKFSIDKCRKPNASISSDYTNRTSATISSCPSGGGGEYTPTQYQPKYNSVSYVPRMGSTTYDMLYNPQSEPPAGDDMIDVLGRGVNAYGVVSNSNLVPNYTDADWDSIALHFDHVRLVLYGFADNGSANIINSSVLTYLTSMVDECKERGMVAVIDYHSPAWATTSYTTDTRAEYLAHWGQIANTLSSYDTTEVVYELVNEPHYSLTLSEWNTLAQDAVDAIRAYDTEKYIMVSPGYWAGVKGLYDFVLPDDDKLIVSLHYYNPRTLTHQCAAWGDELPGGGYLSETWCGTPWYAIQPFMDEITKDFAYVDTWLAANGNPPLHIGEIGVYNLADDSTARAPYLNYLTRWIESKGWTWCLWDYDADFGCFADGSYIPVIRDALFVDPMPTPMAYDSTTIYEADFSSTTDNWGVFTGEALTPSSNATLSVSGGELVATVNTPGSSYNDVRIGHTVDLVQGKMYRLSYTIRSASNRGTLPQRLGTRFPWQELMNVGSSGYTNVVSMYYSNVDHYGAKITFDIGGSSATFYISDLKWEELTIADPPAPPIVPVTTYHDGVCPTGASLYTDPDCISQKYSNAPIRAIAEPDDYTNKVYIDPDYSGIESGSYSQPYNHLSDVEASLADNTAYLIKSGTSLILTSQFDINGKDNILFGIYDGTDSVSITTASDIYHFWIENSTSITFRDLYVRNQYRSANVRAAFQFLNSNTGVVPWCDLYNVHIDGQHIGLRFGGSSGLVAVRFINGLIHDTFNDGVYGGNINYLEFSYSRIWDVNQAYNEVGTSATDAPGDCFQLNYEQNQIVMYHSTLDRRGTGNKACIMLESNKANTKVGLYYNTFYAPRYNGTDGSQTINSNSTNHHLTVIGNTFNSTDDSSGDFGIWGVHSNDTLMANVFTGLSRAIQGANGATIVNNTFYDNANVFYSGSATTIGTLKNNIFYDITTLYDGVSAPAGASNNLTTDPAFVNASSGDFSLQSTSDAIDAGTELAYYLYDIEGTTIPQGGVTDIGAYEYTP